MDLGTLRLQNKSFVDRPELVLSPNPNPILKRQSGSQDLQRNVPEPCLLLRPRGRVGGGGVDVTNVRPAASCFSAGRQRERGMAPGQICFLQPRDDNEDKRVPGTKVKPQEDYGIHGEQNPVTFQRRGLLCAALRDCARLGVCECVWRGGVQYAFVSTYFGMRDCLLCDGRDLTAPPRPRCPVSSCVRFATS